MKRIGFLPAVVILLIALIGPALAAGPAGTEKIEPALLERLAAAGRADFLVRFTARADLSPAYTMGWEERGHFVYETLRATAERSQARAIDYLKGRRLDYRTFFAGNDLYVSDGDLTTAQFLATLPEVAFLRMPRRYGVEVFPVDGLVPAEGTYTWNVLDVHAPEAWVACNNGAGIVIADIGTGVQWDHPALDQAYRCPANPGDPACWYDPVDVCGGVPCDDLGSSTHAMGIMVGDDDPALDYMAGVAPGAQWIACKACSTVSCSEVDLIACAEWVLAPGGNPANRPHAVNNGWGGSGCNAWFQPYVSAWVADGIFPAFPPGHSGPSCNTLGSPGDYANVMAATAHNSTRTLFPGASRGPSCFTTVAKPNLCAPGIGIYSAWPSNGWSSLSGTSRSTPHAAAAAAVLMSYNPALIGDIDGLFDCLQQNADPPPDNGNCGVAPGGGNYTYGWGYLNVLSACTACAPALEPPTASFDSNSPVCMGETMVFTDTSQADPPVSEWFWDFGDGGTSNVQNPTHLYASAGNFTVTLVVTNSTGSDSAQDTVTVNPLPAASFDYAPTSGPLPLTVYFTNTSQYAQNPTWDFGDGSPSATGDHVNHTYTLSGTYDVVLTVQSPYGCGTDTATAPVWAYRQGAPPTAAFTADPTEGCEPLEVSFTDQSTGFPPITSWLWDFGDGATSTETNPVHTYMAAGEYTVLLTVENVSGTDSVSGTIAVYPLPAASFDYTPTAGYMPLTVYFTNTSQYAQNPTWDFGDGGTAAGDVVSHTYETSGTFPVTLTVESPYGCGRDGAIADVIVSEPGACIPVSIVRVNQTPAGCVVDFSADLDGTPPFTYTWDLGAFGTFDTPTATVDFRATGTYTGVLTVWNCGGVYSDTLAFEVVVECAPPPRWSIYLPIIFRIYP